jgi:hypothetical protein
MRMGIKMSIDKQNIWNEIVSAGRQVSRDEEANGRELRGECPCSLCFCLRLLLI